MEDFIVRLIYWITTAIMWWSIVSNWRIRKKMKDAHKMLHESSDKIMADYDKFTQEYTERANLLSRENVKLRMENDMLKDRLRDLGIKDFDVI